MPPRPPPSKARSRLKPDERISAIIAATRQLISEKGYENALTSEIALRCGISEATIYKYFATKRELLSQVAERWMVDLVSRAPPAAAPGTLVERLRGLVWDALAVQRREPSLSRFILMELRFDPGYRAMRIYQLHRAYTEAMLELLEEAAASGQYSADVPPHLLRKMIFGGIEQVTSPYLRGEGDFDLDAAADGITTVIHRAMAQASAPTAGRKAAEGRGQKKMPARGGH